jgi:hypothetical protein
MKRTFCAFALEPRSRFLLWVVLGVVLGFASVDAEAQFAAEQTMTFPLKHNWTPLTALPRELDPLRGPGWGRGGPWADQAPYTPRPKPPGWVDPEPSRWTWTGERDPYDDPNRSQLDDARWPGPVPQTPVGAMPTYPGPPPP